MTIDEALKELEVYSANDIWTNWQRHKDAIKLGVEALKRCNNFRDNSRGIGWYKPLPGETEE